MSLKVYYDLMSQPSRALYIFLRKTGIPYEDKVVALRKHEHKTPEYVKVNPFKKVPCIDDNGFYLNESVAIFRYLSANHAIADHWYPIDIKRRVKIDAFLNWQNLDIRLAGGTIFQTSIKPLVDGSQLNQHRLEMGRQILQSSLNQMEGIFLKETPYIYSDEISIADIVGLCEVMQPAILGEPTFDGRPKLKAWSDRVSAELNPDFDVAHKPLTKMCAAIKKGLAALKEKEEGSTSDSKL